MNKKSYITPASKVVELGEESMLLEGSNYPKALHKSSTTRFFDLAGDDTPNIETTVTKTGAGWDTFDDAD